MKKTTSLLLSVLIAVVLIATVFTSTAYATTTTIELETRSALLIDCSGSMEDHPPVELILRRHNITAFDAVIYFDTEVSTENGFAGGGNSGICEAIDKAVTGGFTHITVVTDGQQWPADYSALGVYTDLDLTIELVEESKASDELINQLRGRLTKSDLKVVTPDGKEKVILDEYEAPIYEIELPDSEEGDIINEGDNTTIIEGDDYVCNCDCCKCNHKAWSWWWLLLLLIPLLILLLWWLFRNWKVARKIKGSHAVVDCSTSMTQYLKRLYRACRNLGVPRREEIIRFGVGASLESLEFLKDVQGEGSTNGWQALQLALDQGWDEITLISDLGFNGEAVRPSGRFKKITVVAPAGYSSATLDKIKSIADEVEVLHL